MADAAVIETLLIKIGADIIDLKKGVADSSKELRSLDKVTQDASRGMTASFNNIKVALAGVFAGVGLQQLTRFINETVAGTAALGRFAAQAGVTSEEFQRLSFTFRELAVTEEQFAQVMAVLSRNMSDLQRNTGPLLEFLRQSAPQFIDNFRAAGSLSEQLVVLSDVLSRASNIQDAQRLATTAGGEQMGRFLDVLRRGPAALEELGRGFKALTDEQIKAAAELDRRWNELTNNITRLARQAVLGVAEQIGAMGPSLDELNARMDQFAARAQAARQRMNELSEGTMLYREEQRKLNEALAAMAGLSAQITMQSQQLAAANKPVVDQWKAQSDSLKVLQADAALLQDALSGIPLTAQLTTPAFVDAFAKMDEAMKRSGAVAAQITLMKRNLARQEQQTILDTASMTANVLTQVFAKNKGAAIGAAIINTAVGVTKALSASAPPWNFIQAALVAASGAAQIASIRSATEQGGGSAATPSGGGAVAGGAAEESVNRSITIQGVDRNALFSGTQVAQLIDVINEETKRGSTLIATTLRPT